MILNKEYINSQIRNLITIEGDNEGEIIDDIMSSYVDFPGSYISDLNYPLEAAAYLLRIYVIDCLNNRPDLPTF